MECIRWIVALSIIVVVAGTCCSDYFELARVKDGKVQAEENWISPTPVDSQKPQYFNLQRVAGWELYPGERALPSDDNVSQLCL